MILFEQKNKVESKTMDSEAGNCCSRSLQILPQVITWWITAVLQTDELSLCLLLQLVSFILKCCLIRKVNYSKTTSQMYIFQRVKSLQAVRTRWANVRHEIWATYK